MTDIQFYNDNAIVNVDDVSMTYETVEKPREFDKYRTPNEGLDWTNQEYQIENYRVFPYGASNDLPKVIKDTILNNSLAPGILKKKTQLLWGKGPKLYKETMVKGDLVREWQDDKQIQNWLNGWGYLDYLTKIVVDYSHIEGVFTKFYLSKGSRIGRNAISKLEHVSPDDARLAEPKESNRRKPTHCIITDWTFKKVTSITDFKVYALFDFLNPFKNRNAILYSNMYSFCSEYYTVPDIYGSLEWIRRSSAIPLILKSLSKNSINLKYHVTSPAIFWEKKEDELKAKCEEKGKKYTSDLLLKYKKMFLKKIAEVLSGEENTGKFWHSVKHMEIDGHKIIEHGWEIKEIKQNIKDFVAAQIKISDQANRAVAGGVGMHPALGGAGESGRADSGSEQLYALKNYLLTGIDIPEMIVLKAINYAIQANFPQKDLKLGFYHIAPQREEDITSSDRIKEQV